MLRRYSVAVFFGLIATTGLFFVMQGLISNDQVAFEEKERPMKLFYLSVIEEPEFTKKILAPVKPPPPELPPQATPDFLQEPGGDAVFEGPKVFIVDDPNITVSRLTDGTYLPIVKVTPQYPRRALARGIEGYVMLEFTVTKTGAVVSPRVIESEPSGVFDAAAIKAALRFKYKPRVVDGVAVPVGGVNNLITFSISGEA